MQISKLTLSISNIYVHIWGWLKTLIRLWNIFLLIDKCNFYFKYFWFLYLFTAMHVVRVSKGFGFFTRIYFEKILKKNIISIINLNFFNITFNNLTTELQIAFYKKCFYGAFNFIKIWWYFKTKNVISIK